MVFEKITIFLKTNKSIKSMALFYIFASLFNTYLNRKGLDCLTCLFTFYSLLFQWKATKKSRFTDTE